MIPRIVHIFKTYDAYRKTQPLRLLYFERYILTYIYRNVVHFDEPFQTNSRMNVSKSVVTRINGIEVDCYRKLHLKSEYQ